MIKSFPNSVALNDIAIDRYIVKIFCAIYWLQFPEFKNSLISRKLYEEIKLESLIKLFFISSKSTLNINIMISIWKQFNLRLKEIYLFTDK
jgi:hypothetical protein